MTTRYVLEIYDPWDGGTTEVICYSLLEAWKKKRKEIAACKEVGIKVKTRIREVIGE